MSLSHRKKLGILVGGGPAPGINSVIAAATIRALLEGVDVVGIEDGFEWIMQGNIDHVRSLTIDAISRIHFRGGSYIGISRANPTKDPQLLENAVISLLRLGVTDLVTIGGDDTAFSAMKLEEKSAGRIHVVHVPKSIDNDLDLPSYVDTFGYQTARHYGVEIVKNIMVDARTTSRWYFIIAMGRKAGHLAMGIGKAAGATLTLVPEEFTTQPIRLKTLVDTLVCAILKRLAYGRRDGVAVIAEGVVLSIDPADFENFEDVERDAHGHVRIAEVNIGEMLKRAVQRRLKEFNLSTTIVEKNIGYELRCADPVPHDMEYTRDLGYCAAKYLLEGGNAVLVSMQSGQFVPVPFKDLIDPVTGRARTRMVDIHSTRYAIARRYMIRLRRDDFEDEHELARYAATAHMSLEQFREQFEYLIKDELPAIHLFDQNLAKAMRETSAARAAREKPSAAAEAAKGGE
jgi:ATP-dependent phosphofructokinase / diphosphate-dependent phosphofructokinase